MKDFIEQAIRTEPPYELPAERASESIALIHGAMGLTTEVGEFVDQIKKHIFYGKDIDYVNLVEEIGDIFWYVAIICDKLDIDFEDAQSRVISKLRIRYPEKFTNYDALNRKLEEERKALE